MPTKCHCWVCMASVPSIETSHDRVAASSNSMCNSSNASLMSSTVLWLPALARGRGPGAEPSKPPTTPPLATATHRAADRQSASTPNAWTTPALLGLDGEVSPASGAVRSADGRTAADLPNRPPRHILGGAHRGDQRLTYWRSGGSGRASWRSGGSGRASGPLETGVSDTCVVSAPRSRSCSALLSTLLPWRSAGVAGPPEPPADGVAAWVASSTTSATRHGLRFELLGEDARTAAPPDEALQRNCVLATSRGGRYTLDNVVPACPSCNASECNAEVTGWLRRKRLDERAFLVRHLEVRTALAPHFGAVSGV